MKLRTKIGGGIAAIALVIGAVPMAIAPAAAIETGQMRDKGPRWPHKTSHYVALGLGIAAAIATILLVAGSDDDKPTSP